MLHYYHFAHGENATPSADGSILHEADPETWRWFNWLDADPAKGINGNRYPIM